MLISAVFLVRTGCSHAASRNGRSNEKLRLPKPSRCVHALALLRSAAAAPGINDRRFPVIALRFVRRVFCGAAAVSQLFAARWHRGSRTVIGHMPVARGRSPRLRKTC